MGSVIFSAVILLIAISLIDSGVDAGLLIYFYSKLFCNVLFSVWLTFGTGAGTLSIVDVVVLFKMRVGVGYILFVLLLKFSEILS